MSTSKPYAVVELEPREEHEDGDLPGGFTLVKRIDGDDVTLAFEPTLERLETEIARLSGRYLLFAKDEHSGHSLAGDFQTLEDAKEYMAGHSYDMFPYSDWWWIEREGEGVIFGERPSSMVSLGEILEGEP